MHQDVPDTVGHYRIFDVHTVVWMILVSQDKDDKLVQMAYFKKFKSINLTLCLSETSAGMSQASNLT